MVSRSTDRETGPILVWAFVALVIAAMSVYALGFPINHDVAWWLYVARSSLQGEILYRDLFEINPPLYGYFARLPVLLASALNLDLLDVVPAMVLGLAVVIVFGTAAFLARDRLRGYATPLLALLLSVPVIVLPGYDWGQREHLMFMMVLPYLALMALRLGGRDVSGSMVIPIGIAGGLGFALKPHFMVLWLALELASGLWSRKGAAWARRGEVLAAAAVMAAYVAFVFLAHGEYIDYVLRVAHLYSPFATSPFAALLLHRTTIVVAVTLLGAWLLRPWDARVSRLIGVLLLFAVGALGVALLARQDWPYHYYPAAAAATTAGVLLIVGFARRAYRDRAAANLKTVPTVILLASLLLLLLIGRTTATRQVMLPRAAADLRTAAEIDASGAESVLVLSVRLFKAFPLVIYTDAEWASPFPSMFWLDAAHGDSIDASRLTPKDEAERFLHGRMTARIVHVRPDVVLVDTTANPLLGGAVVPYVAYLSIDEEFRRLWSEYDRAGSMGKFAVYRRRSAR